MSQKLLLFIILLFNFSLYAYSEPRVAVIPFSAKNTSDIEAEAITSVFETALVKLDKYAVIEQTQMDEILSAQAYSLSGCTDDSCAVEVGELLSAKQIILGSLTKIGSKYLLTAKMIDVETGEHLKADDVQSDSIDEMLDQARALAYSLSGMAYQYQPKAGDEISYGEIYITTSPDKAEIYINGKRLEYHLIFFLIYL